MSIIKVSNYHAYFAISSIGLSLEQIFHSTISADLNAHTFTALQILGLNLYNGLNL